MTHCKIKMNMNIYKHPFFVLDPKGRKIFDENNKELHITGNAYRVLVFLCEKQHATLSEIGERLDWAKDYTENHIRQYRYKINSIIGHDVIEYKNGIYSIRGEIKKIENLVENNRNTDLLQPHNVESKEKSIMNEKKSIKFTTIPAIVAGIFLLLTVLDMPYGYYTFMKIVVTGVAIYYAYYIHLVYKKYGFWFWGLVAITLLFNPIIPIYLKDKAIWLIIDVIVAVFFIGMLIKLKLKK